MVTAVRWQEGEDAMQQIKLFKGVESDLARLEQTVNDWLRESRAHVLQVTGNIAPQSGPPSVGGGSSQSPFTPSDVLVLVVYETG
jgi:hypothetical protein